MRELSLSTGHFVSYTMARKCSFLCDYDDAWFLPDQHIEVDLCSACWLK